MAPKRGESVERTTEREEFMTKLEGYHEKRGTNLEREPKVGVRHVDLHKLYNRVVEEGGYDLCSDTKAKPLMWRKFAEEFVGKNQYTAAQAFQIKNVYYKNLVAYEITEHWKQEPPPKEILEEVTAKGGNVMTRTLENYTRPPTKEELNLGGGAGAGGEGSDVASPEQKTPKLEKTEDGDNDPGSATGGRTTRGLRQQPPQRTLFAPDLTAQGRQTRGAAASAQSPTPGTSLPPTSMLNGAATSATLASYEPSQSYPLSLRPLVTPANNPDHYRQALKRKAETTMGPLAKKYKNIMLPGTGFVGPNIYVRAQLALQSGIAGEEEYALHHLVKISHERGDKYRFDQFPGLAEALLRKCLSVCGLFYDVEWDISYDYEMMSSDDEMLDGLRGTPDIVRRMQNTIPKVTDDSLETPEFVSQLNRILEAGLVLRNMSLQPENAKYLVAIPTTRDYLAAVLHLPPHPAIIELQHYALDTAEQLLVWCDLGSRDALYQALLAQLTQQDRGAITIALRTLARIGMHLPQAKRLDDITFTMLRKVQSWLLVEDEELRAACLDFLFQYTSSADNVAHLLAAVNGTALAKQLSCFLLFAAKEERRPAPSSGSRDADDQELPASIPKLSRSVIGMLLDLPEPERSSEWLRMCFAPAHGAEITQIALWQAYQATFAPFNTSQRSHLVAGEFIKNVSATFAGATAQVAQGGKYVIRGIKARKAPVEAGLLPGGGSGKGTELGKCGWLLTHEQECGEWFLRRKEGEEMLEHVLSEHLHLPRRTVPAVAVKAEDVVESMEIDSPAAGLSVSRPASAMAVPDGKHTLSATYDLAAADQHTYRCCWAGGCQRSSADFDGSKMSRTALFARHIRTHLPDANALHTKHNLDRPASSKKQTAGGEKVLYQGLVDEKGDAAGIPLSAALVLRNLAKFMPGARTAETTAGAAAGKKGGEDDVELMARIFDDEVAERLVWALTVGRPVHLHVGSVLRAIGRGGAGSG